jgi:3-oxoacyl-[acyl-carrier protein] reductase
MKDKIILITGGASGLGLSLSTSLLQQDAFVIIADINCQPGKDTINQANRINRARFFNIDLNKQTEIENLIQYAITEFGKIDVIINNAKPPLQQGGVDALINDWDQGMSVMVKAPALLALMAADYMEKGSCIINITSTNAHFISHQPLIYHLAKAALLQLTRYLARELGHKGIRVNAISPGLVNIPGRGFLNSKKNQQITIQAVPLERAATTDDIAAMLSLICSENASYLNGQEITLDGGLSVNDHFHLAYQAYDLHSKKGEKT